MVTRAHSKRLDGIKKSIRSYCGQSYSNKELVIVLDRPSRHEQEQLLSFLKKLKRRDIRWFKSTTQKSLGELRNLSIDRAQGEYVCQWDDDDVYHPNRVELQYGYLYKNRLDAVFLRYVLHVLVAANACFFEDWKKAGGFPPSLLVKKAICPKYRNISLHEDTYFQLELISKFKVGWLQNPPDLYFYIFHGGNLTNIGHHVGIAKKFSISEFRLQARHAKLTSSLKSAGLYNAKLKFFYKNARSSGMQFLS